MADLTPTERWANLSRQWAAHRDRARVKWDAAMQLAFTLNGSLMAVLGCDQAHVTWHKITEGPVPAYDVTEKVGHPLEAIEIGDDGRARFGMGILLESGPEDLPKQRVVIPIEIEFAGDGPLSVKSPITDAMTVRTDREHHRMDVEAFSERFYIGLMRSMDAEPHKRRIGFSMPAEKPETPLPGSAAIV